MSEAIYINRENAPLVDYVAGRVVLNVHISNCCEIDDELDDAMAAWFNGEHEVAIGQHFTLTDVLTSALDSFGIPPSYAELGADTKPMFDAMRAELVAMVARIDTLTFAAPPKDKP